MKMITITLDQDEIDVLRSLINSRSTEILADQQGEGLHDWEHGELNTLTLLESKIGKASRDDAFELTQADIDRAAAEAAARDLRRRGLHPDDVFTEIEEDAAAMRLAKLLGEE